ncbi:hypothetical protein BD779DRAFT_1673850 [Infundibulicybe gibba]|nr:hypothetical protein BD779DRAFT_1673850 [Infundibulicybe gibba]
MFFVNTLAFVLGATIPLAAAHGVITSPKPRVGGAASKAACGTGASTVLTSDIYGPIENAVKKIDSGYNATACHLFFCRGYQYADNTANTRAYKPGTVVNMLVDLEAHHTGYANVSIFDLATQKAIGSPLMNWPVYANDTLGPADWPANETNFNVVIPNLGTKCSAPGACAIQWWWYGYNGQTYESCVDFTS